jgi:hypothetical protein
MLPRRPAATAPCHGQLLAVLLMAIDRFQVRASGRCRFETALDKELEQFGASLMRIAEML